VENLAEIFILGWLYIMCLTCFYMKMSLGIRNDKSGGHGIEFLYLISYCQMSDFRSWAPHMPNGEERQQCPVVQYLEFAVFHSVPIYPSTDQNEICPECKGT